MKDAIIIVLIVLVLFLFSMRVASTFTPGQEPTITDVKTMLSSGMPEVNVIVSLIKSGVPSDKAEQLVMQAKST